MTGSEKNRRGELPVHIQNDKESLLYEEVKCVIGRNKNEQFLQALLTRARILEDILKK